MKYIDAEKLIAELTKLQFTLNASYRNPQSDNMVRAISLEYDDILSLVDSLQQEQPNKYETALEKARKWIPNVNQGGHTILIDIFPELGEGLDPRYGGRKQEQPECGCSEKPNNLSSEWTEEDERTRWNLCSLLTNLRVGKKIEESTFKKYYSWLKIIHIKPRKTRKSEQPEVDLDAIVDEAFDKYSSVDGYGQLAASFNRAELYSFIKKIARKLI